MKKFSAILVCLLMIITCGLAGCATFSINKVKYYNEVVATVGKTEITRFELLTAYNSYGQSYYTQQMQQSEKEALSNTLDLLIDRELMYQHALKNESVYKPTRYQVNDIVNEMFNSLDSQMDEYVQTAKTILNIESSKTNNEEEKEETAYKRADYNYKPRAFVKERMVNGTVEYYIDYNENYLNSNTELTESNTKIGIQYINNFKLNGIVEEIKTKYLAHFKKTLEVEEKENANIIYNKAISLFAKDLIDYEHYLRDSKNKPYNKNTNDLIYRYIERTFNSQIQSQYIENIRISYLEQDELSIDLLINEYNYLSTLNYNQYTTDHTAYKDKMKNISTDGNSVLYHPETDTQFGYFIHTLLSFDSIKDKLTALKEDVHDYKTQYANIVNSLTLKPRNLETGLIDENATSVSLSSILTEYNNIATNPNYDYDEKLSKFIDFMFTYTGDTATLNQGMPYVVGTNGYSAMVEEFNNEAILLMTGKNKDGETVGNAQKGNMSKVNLTSENLLDEICITEYGIHLLFYIGDVNSFDIPQHANVTIETTPSDYIENENSSKYNMYNKIVNPLTNKTYFDMMFDLVYPATSGEVYTSNNGYTEYEKDLTTETRKTHKVVKYTTKIKATKTKI